MNQASSHLTDRQISDYVQDSTTGPAAQQLEAHLADCESCLDRLLHAERIHLGLLEGNGMKRTPYPGCPPEEALQELAAGICASDTAQTTTEHAAHCNYCGPLLNRYLKEFSEDVQPEDAAVLRELKTSTPGWQKNFIRENLRSEKQEPQGWFTFWPRLLTASAVGVAAAVVAFFSFRPNDLEKAQQLVASAYSERRTTEMRFPSAPHAPFQPTRVERSGDSGVDWTTEPGPLLQAEAILNQQRKSGDLNPQWLEVEGRISLLQAKPESAQQAARDFERALSGDANNARLKIDLAASYFEEDLRADHPDLVRTIDLLTEVLKTPSLGNDDRAAAQFDLAIAYEKSEMWDLAVAEWQDYLRGDSSSTWASEAQKHLEDARKKIPPPRQQGFNSPSAFLEASSTSDVQKYIEPYQGLALGVWLSAAIEDSSSVSSKAVHKLATLLEQQHSDTWWRDFLRDTKPNDLPAVRALSAAFVANVNDLSNEALQESRKAADLFAHHRNPAGELRARFEEVYALQRNMSSAGCLTHAEELSRRLEGTKYRWLQTQAALEKATCANWLSNFKTVTANVDLSREMAADFHFPELALRIMGLDAGMRRQQTKYDEAWAEAVAGLHRYWQGSYAPERLYQFYSVMSQIARDTHSFHAAEPLLLQAIAIRESNLPDDLTLRAVLYLRLANELRRQGESALADEKSSKAVLVLKQVKDQSAQKHVFLTQIETAELALQRGNPALALSEISSIRELLQTQEDFVNLDFYRVLGNIHRQLQQFDKAVETYESAVAITERSLHEMQDDASRVRWITATEETYRGLTQSLLAQKEDRKALAAWERFKSRSVQVPEFRNDENRPEASVEISAGSLPPVSERHLIYASFNDGLQLWFVNGSAIKSQAIPIKKADLEAQVREFAENCSNPRSTSERLRREGSELYRLLLGPVVAELSPTQPVAIELDQPLAALPVEALMSPDGSYFGDVYSVVYSPGLLVESTLRFPVRPRSADSFLLIDSSTARGGGNLPGHMLEQDSVTRAFPQRTLITPADATIAKVKQALRNSIGLDFIGHGRPEGTGTALVLSSSLSLRAADLSPDDMPQLRFAVFSACSSGSAQNGLLDTGSLVRSLFAGRVPTVIASHWNVDSESTAQFMKAFYSRLSGGEAVDQALREARKQLHSSNPHPYYWAAFSLNGRVS